MPNRLRSNVSGKETLKFFESYGFEIDKRTRGSHLVLHRKLSFGDQILVIPLHKTVSRGTLKAILKQSCKYIPEKDLFDNFYTK